MSATYRNYKLLQKHFFDEIRAEYIHLQHPCGTQIVYLGADDPENVFAICLQTLPTSSNGAPHILEHTVLCGSEKYPVRDPFFSMQKRSLSTYMNALTSADFTCYPAASQIREDFYNLFEVYIDAVFHPKLNPLLFSQEGIRVELKSPKDLASSPLEYHGIVFNEMKGAMSSPDSRLWEAMMQGLYPDTPYSFNSGGDPIQIPNLTYDELVEFHTHHYAKARSIIYFYGNIPLDDHLDFLDREFFPDALPLDPLPLLPKQKRFSHPVSLKRSYPTEKGDTDAKPIFAKGMLTTTAENQLEALALYVLDSALMETDASPLKRVLLDSHLCDEVESFLDTELPDSLYAIVCKGCPEKNVPALEKLLYETLTHIAKTGIEKEWIEAALHQVEMSRCEISSDHGPYGLTLFLRIAQTLLQGLSVENTLSLKGIFDTLHKKFNEPHFISHLITTYFLQNPHQITLVLTPDPSLHEREEKLLQHQLESIRKNLSEEQANVLVEQGAQLKKLQETKDDLSVLPKLALSQIPSTPLLYPLNLHQTPSLQIFHHNCFTNHFVYADLFYTLPDLTLQELLDAQFFLSILGELGCGSFGFKQMLQEIQRYSGGIEGSLHFYPQHSLPHLAKPALAVRGKSLVRHIDRFFPLLKMVVEQIRFDEYDRLKELTLQTASHLQQRLARSALSYGSKIAQAPFSIYSTLQHHLSGIGFYEYIQATKTDAGFDAFFHRLPKVVEKLFHKKCPDLVLSCDAQSFNILDSLSFGSIGEVCPFIPYWQPTIPLVKSPSQVRTVSSTVAANCLALPTVHGDHPDAPYLAIACLIAENRTLHHEIRERGGAYGASASFVSSNGTFYLYSYRDPNIESTYRSFMKSLEMLAKKDFDESHVEEAIFGVIQSSDSPLPPGSRGITAYNWLRMGRTPEIREQTRKTLLSATAKDIARACEEHLISRKEQAVFVSVCGENVAKNEKQFIHSHQLSVSPLASK